MRKAGWITMTSLALIIAGYALAVLLLPGFGPPFIVERRATMPLAVICHLAGGALALALGPWQFNARLRERWIQIHRWTGRSYIVAVLVGGSAALVLARRSQDGLVTHAGFGLLAVAWLTATVTAYTRIRAGDQESHRRWMIRSYALTLAAVTLRIYLPASQILRVPFADAYQAVAWMCWVPNLIVAEWWILRRAPSAEGARAFGRGGLAQ